MQTLTTAVLPILLVLVMGYVIGRLINQEIRSRLVRLITPLVWLLLFSIGHRFGDVLGRAAEARHVMALAFLLAVLTTVFPWLLIVPVSHPDVVIARFVDRKKVSFRAVLRPLKECVAALLMVVAGVLVSFVEMPTLLSDTPLPSTNQFLYALICLVGVDLVGISIDRKWFSLRTLAIPLLVILGSLVGGVVEAMVVGQPLKVALALSSGFGWFTLSSVLVAKYLGSTYGTIALLTDLFRELLAIVLLYGLGARFPRPCIGASGATALDSTLPIIKQACMPAEIPAALISGLILTLMAPLLITLFLMR